MSSKILISFLLVLMVSACIPDRSNSVKSSDPADPAAWIDPFIGTDAHGHTFPGASVPFGMVQLSPDTRLEGWDGCSGYHYSDSIVYGFSHTALSGTGVPDYADILFMPTTGSVHLDNGSENVDEGYASRFSHERELAEAGYYRVTLDDYNIEVELTTTKRVGFHTYRFNGDQPANIILDLEHRDKVLDSWIRILDYNRIEGFRRSSSWAADQHVYFAADFSVPFKNFSLALKDSLQSGEYIRGENVKSFFQFDLPEDQTIYVKVALSAVSAEGAWENMKTEIPHWNFEQVRKEAFSAWNKELQKIEVEGASKEQKTTFYTALYHAFLVPNLFQDADGRYRGRDLEIHDDPGFDYYTVFSLWDTFRAEHPLFTLVQQDRTTDMIRTMLAQYDQGGRLPVWELAANETECMIGYHSIPVIVDAWKKGIRDFDEEKALDAMVHSANLDHFGLSHYKTMGYIPAHEESESVSKTLEYAYDDWCIAMMAKELGETEIYERFLERAQSYKNIFDPSTGFMRAKMNGRWFEPFDPKEVNFNYTEANSWQYSFFVPQDIRGLSGMMGGEEVLLERLDQLFEENSETTGRQQSDITGLIGQYAHGNEPSHHIAYLYSYLGQPWKTQDRVRQILDELYTPHPDGLCGNEDCGQMSAWYVMSSMGMYPVTPGDPVYALGSPLFDKISLNLENGNTFVIRTVNNGPENRYIQEVKLNGKKYQKTFITHRDIVNGGELELTMGSEPNTEWGVAVQDRPVSAITEQLILPVPYVHTGERTFVENTEVSLGTILPGCEVYFTLDGSEPSEKSERFQTSFVLEESATLKARAYKQGMPPSHVLTAEFHKIPVGRTITLNTKYAGQYSGGGDLCLIDFIRGPLNFRTGAWQGYEGVDLNAVVDLGSIQLINSLETGFLQDVGAWIFMPLEVDYYVSMDGSSFQHAGTVQNEVSPRALGVNIQNFRLNYSTKARYVKVVAKNRGVCPDWHAGAGREAWIFADEIHIE